MNRHAKRFWIALPVAVLVLYSTLLSVAVMSASPAAIIAFGVAPALVVPEANLLPAPFNSHVAAWRIKSAGSKFRAKLFSDPTITPATPYLLRSAGHRESGEQLAAAARIADALVSVGMSLDKRNFVGCSALQVAVLHGDEDLRHFLISKGVDVNEVGLESAREPMCRMPAAQLGKNQQ